ncbi:hypothetical protein LCGC14_2610870 [marine sediment metagenome]|uniref:Uncharacterized protein n=1 Tax=marine sediment metagenome TaxID=412755 RepID=A0A0F9CYP2_9ZZZZ
MPIFIAKTYDGKVESVVLAKNYEVAQAYWQGKDIYPHSVNTFTEDNLKNHPVSRLLFRISRIFRSCSRKVNLSC